jgi:hypothetical protein
MEYTDFIKIAFQIAGQTRSEVHLPTEPNRCCADVAFSAGIKSAGLSRRISNQLKDLFFTAFFNGMASLTFLYPL